MFFLTGITKCYLFKGGYLPTQTEKKSMNQRSALTVEGKGVSTATKPVSYLSSHLNGTAIIVRGSGVYTAGLPAGLTRKESMNECWSTGFNGIFPQTCAELHILRIVLQSTGRSCQR